MAMEKINPHTLYDGAAIGLSQAVIHNALGLVFVSGQVDWNLEQQVQHKSIKKQTEGALENLKKVLIEAGSSLDKIVQIRIYARGELAEFMPDIAPVFAQYFADIRPAMTGVGVTSLASTETLVEIEAIATL